MKNKLLIAHRGHSGSGPIGLENTKSAFNCVFDAGFDGIEMDVHLTKDNRIVINHDPTIDRTSDGKGRISDYTLKELREFDFGHHNKETKEREFIMTYEEFLIYYGDKFKQLNIELKKEKEEHYEGMEEIMSEITQRINPKAEILFSSFSLTTLKKIYKLNNKATLGFLIDKNKNLEEHMDEVKKICTYIHPWYQMLFKEDSLALFKEANLKLNVWTLDVEEANDEWTNGSVKAMPEVEKHPLFHSIIANIPYKFQS
ncbi:MAG: glycerophosphodiester phosphodiesterase [Mycoplasmataceae bacterium]|nr:glycerophosphodiester phosphodiesterase [Mycoplasmataceae bacterium]